MDNADKEYNIEIAPVVNDRMAEHIEFLSRVSPNASDKLLLEMLKDIKSLKKMPERCPHYNRPYLPIGKYRFKSSANRYRIVFQIIGNCVFVDDIQDCRQSDIQNIV